MRKIKLYGYKESKYQLWLERDIDLYLRDQKVMAIIVFGMIIGVLDVFLYAVFRLALYFWFATAIAIALTIIAMQPLWRYTKKQANYMKGSFYLRAVSNDVGYHSLQRKVSEILNENNFEYRQKDDGFGETLKTDWLPKKEIILMMGELKIVELKFDITREEGLELKLNSLSMFPELEVRLINGLDEYFSMKPDGKVLVR